MLEGDVGINVFNRNSSLTFNASASGFEEICQRLLSSDGTSQRDESTPPATGRRLSS